MIKIKFRQARNIIREGDVLLFRGQSWASYFISVAGEGVHTHVGVASWHDDLLECVEFKEWRGGRAVNLQRQVNENPGLIDVFRPVDTFASFDFRDGQVHSIKKKFDAKCVTDNMRKLTGLPYGWKRIWWIFRHKAIGLRLWRDNGQLVDDTVKELIYPVCSTSLAWAFSSCGFDLVKQRSDQWTEPADIARSARLSYLFTLNP